MDIEIIKKRKAGLQQFAEESYPVIIDFAERLEHPDPSSLLLDNTEMSYFIGNIHQFLENEVIDEETLNWVAPRIGYVLGEYLIQKYKGYWGLNENENSLQYGHYVACALSPKDPQKTYPVDTFESAYFYCSQPAPRNLVALVDEIEAVLI